MFTEIIAMFFVFLIFADFIDLHYDRSLETAIFNVVAIYLSKMAIIFSPKIMFLKLINSSKLQK